MTSFIFPREGQTSLLIIDIQERLFAAMDEAEVQALLKNTHLLLELARTFEWPVYYTEQYPKGLGPTEASLREKLFEMEAVGCEKIEFSAARNDVFRQTILPRLTPNVIVVGMETHVCVLQTVADLQARGIQTFVPSDALASRSIENKRNGIKLMEAAGAVETNTETLMFYALQKAGNDIFRHFSKMIR